MGDGGATVIVHQTWASQPDGCIPLPPSWVGIASDPEEEPLRVYETATLIAGDDALRQEYAFHHSHSVEKIKQKTWPIYCRNERRIQLTAGFALPYAP